MSQRNGYLYLAMSYFCILRAIIWCQSCPFGSHAHLRFVPEALLPSPRFLFAHSHRLQIKADR
jgi:hypothetical protein